MEKIYFTERQLAERWKCSVRKLQADRVFGTGCPYMKIGRLVRYELRAIEVFERAALRENTSSRNEGCPGNIGGKK